MQGWRDGDASVIYSILSSLAHTSRFSLSVDFLSKQEKQAVSAVCTQACQYMRVSH